MEFYEGLDLIVARMPLQKNLQERKPKLKAQEQEKAQAMAKARQQR